MKTKLALLLIISLASFSFAGTPVPDPVTPPPAPAPAFAPGLVLDIAGNYSHQPATDSTAASHGYGATASIGYWFMPEVGVRINAVFADLKPSSATFSADLMGRLPLSSDPNSVLANIAPYVFGGAGISGINSTGGQYHAGGGVEYKISPKLSLYTEGIYNSINLLDTTKPINVTVGLRLNF